MLGKHTLKPREKTSLRITYNTEGRPGPFRKNIAIATDVPGQEEVEIVMEGSVKETPAAKIKVNPRKVDMGLLKVETGKEQSFEVSNTGVLPLIITKIYSKGNNRVYYDADKDGRMEVAPGQTRQIKLSVKVSQGGSFSETVIIESNAKNTTKGGLVIIVTGKGEI